MKLKSILSLIGCLAICFSMSACKKSFSPEDGAPPAAQVIKAGDPSLVMVDNAKQFALIAAGRQEAPVQLKVTGSVFPDIAREVPVISLANGRVVDIKARLDDNVKKGQLLLKVQSPDVTNAFDAYLKASNDEQLANKTYERARKLYEHGAIALGALEQAEDTEKDAQADLKAAMEQLDTLGVDRHHPSSIVPVYAPISGVIVAQNVTNAAAVGANLAGSATAFTIADLSTVWIVCDVYENDIPKLALGETAQIQVNAYPDRPLMGRVSDIGPVLDPNLRTAKVRIEVPNSGLLRLGMYVTATISSKNKNAYALVPAAAILHLHDRDWVYVPSGDKQFRRVEVTAGEMQPGKMQQILSGIAPGQMVVSNVLQLESTLEAQ